MEEITEGGVESLTASRPKQEERERDENTQITIWRRSK